MPKERNYNPVQAQRKAEKAKAIKKGKAEIQERRNERLAQKNPDRIQKQIDDLKAIAASAKLSRHEEQLLEGLEKEIKVIRKAREALGDKAPSFGHGPRRNGDARILGKRRRGSAGSSSTDEDVPEDVRRIPMPRDTPPPFPKEVLDQWFARRRARRNQENASAAAAAATTAAEDQGAKKEEARSRTGAPAAAPQTVYEAKPVLRNLQKEAVSAFVPAVVQRKLNKGRGQGGLMEPDEADRLEQEGYLTSSNGAADGQEGLKTATVEDAQEDE